MAEHFTQCLIFSSVDKNGPKSGLQRSSDQSTRNTSADLSTIKAIALLPEVYVKTHPEIVRLFQRHDVHPIYNADESLLTVEDKKGIDVFEIFLPDGSALALNPLSVISNQNCYNLRYLFRYTDLQIMMKSVKATEYVTPAVDASNANVFKRFLKCSFFLGSNEYKKSLSVWHDTQVSFLGLAIDRNQGVLLRLLLKHGANVNDNVSHKHDYKVLHFAAANKSMNPEVVKILIQHGADVNARSRDGESPLHFAAAQRTPTIAELLIKAGAVVDAKDKYECTPLFFVEHDDVCKILIKYGANVNSKDKHGNSPLHSLAAENCPSIIRSLIEAGAVVDAKDCFMRTPLFNIKNVATCKILIRSGADVCSKDKYNNSPLHGAVSRCCTSIVQLLIDAGANVNAINESEETPLFGVRDDDVFKILIQGGADVENKGDRGRSPLHSAAERRNPSIIQLLIEAGVAVDAKDCNGCTALHNTRYHGVVSMLIKHGADVNGRDNNGRSSLHYMNRMCSPEVAETLLQSKADVNALDNQLETPLFRAVNNDLDLDYVKVLLKFGADVYMRFGNRSILSLASTCDENDTRSEVFQYLLDRYFIDPALLKESLSECGSDYHHPRILKEHTVKIQALNLKYLDYEGLPQELISYWSCEEGIKLKSECELEVALLKSQCVANTDVSLYDVLTRNEEQVGRLLRIGNFAEILESEKLVKRFPIYGNMLTCHIEMASSGGCFKRI